MPSKFGGIPVDNADTSTSKQSKFGGIPVADAPPPQPLADAGPVDFDAVEMVKSIPSSAMGLLKDMVTGRKRMTPEIQGMAEVGSAPEANAWTGAALKSSLGLLTESDPEIVKQVLQKQFGNEVSFRQDEKGNDIAIFPSGEYALNRPGLSYQDVLSGIFDLAAFTPSGRGAKFAAGAAKGGLTQAGIESAGASVGGDFNLRKVPEAALMVGGGNKLSGVISDALGATKVAAKNAPPPAVAPQVAEAVEASAETNIPLFRAQQELDPALIEKQSFVAQLPAGAKQARAALTEQNRAAGEAVDSLLAQIAPDDAIVLAQPKFQNAAQEAIEKARMLREEKTSPLFEGAFKEGAEVDLAPVKGMASKTLDEFPETGEVPRTLKKALNLIAGRQDTIVPGGRIVDQLGAPITAEQRIKNPPTLRQLANAKIEIDQMLSRKLDGSLGHQTKANLTALKNRLLEQMDKASPQYKFARNEFYRGSGPINALEESIIGKIANLDPTQMKRISGMIFDPAQSNPAVVFQAKKVIDDVSPDAWSLLLRSEVERRMGTIRPKVGTVVENIPGELKRAIFGNNKQRSVLMAGLTPQQRKSFSLLETALGRAQLGRPGGSQTAAREEIKRELRGGIVQSLRDFFSAPLRTTANIAEDKTFDRRVRAMAKVLFDPEYAPKLQTALKDKSGQSFGHLLYVATDQLHGDSQSEPPASGQQELKQSQ